ncbi:MAG: hypothetical protein ACOZJZ_22010 [Pseudomonadota bacterium]
MSSRIASLTFAAFIALSGASAFAGGGHGSGGHAGGHGGRTGVDPGHMAQAQKGSARQQGSQSSDVTVRPLDPNPVAKGDTTFERTGSSGTSARVGKTRAEVKRELAEWRRNPVTSEGWREVGGETGWVYVGQ